MKTDPKGFYQVYWMKNEDTIGPLKAANRGRGRLKVAYMNINGLMSAMLKPEDYLKEGKPDIMGIVETKLASEGDILNIGEENTTSG